MKKLDLELKKETVTVLGKEDLNSANGGIVWTSMQCVYGAALLLGGLIDLTVYFAGKTKNGGADSGNSCVSCANPGNVCLISEVEVCG
jgi:hypothetical protein